MLAIWPERQGFRKDHGIEQQGRIEMWKERAAA
jgi:hypothetical protein